MRRAIVPVHYLFVLLVMFLGSRDARAVELTGQLRGTVTDPEGLAVPGVVLTLSSPQMQGERQASTDADGEYRFVALPVGDYLLRAEAVGFTPQQVPLRIVSGLTITTDLTLTPQIAGEELIVEDVAPVVDVSTTRTGIVMSKEMLRDLPNAGRDYQSAMDFAPGVVSNGTGNPNIRGGLSFSNQYYVDGVNTTDPTTNTFSMNMNFDVIEEIQVITGGMDAEYGRSMGGAVNIVTRSGGNAFEGDVQVLYNSTETQLYKPLPEEEGLPKPDQAEQMIAANLGGPIARDRLWFFTGVQLNRSLYTPALTQEVRDTYPEGFSVPTRNWRSAYLFGKLTWKPAANHRLWVHAQADPTNIDNAEASAFTLSTGETWWQQGGWLASLGHQWTPDAATVIDTQVSTSHSYIRLRPIQWKDCESYDEVGGCEQDFSEPLADDYPYDPSWFAMDPDGFSYGVYPYAYYSERGRNSLTFAVSRFVEALGEHQFKAGFQGDLLSNYSVYPGFEDGYAYYSYTGEDPGDLESYAPNTLVKFDNNAEAEFTGWIAGWYLQDVWRIGNRLTLRPGVRFEKGRYFNNVGDMVYETPITVAPRMGAAFDLTADGRTSIFGYYGRFYDPGFLEVSSVLAKGLNGGGYYSWDAEAGDWADDPYYAFADTFLVHDDLKVPYSDELTAGLMRDVGGGWALGTTFTYKETRNLFEDDEVNLIWNDDGTEVLSSRDGTGEARYRLRTPDDAFIEYTSLEFQANKQFGDKWGMLASYTWSRSYGRYRDDISQGLASASYDIPPYRQYEVGLLPFDVPHSLKVAGNWRDPYAFDISDSFAVGALFGWNFQMQSGTPYQPTYYNGYFSDWSLVTEPLDGDYRLPLYSRTDIKTGLTLAAGETTWDLTVEVFNLFNSRTVTSVDNAVDGPDGQVRTDEEGNLEFGQALARQQPRYLQLGLRGEF